MTAARTPAITGTLCAAVFAAGISGAAMAGEKQQHQAQGTPNAVTAAPADDTSTNVSTWAAAYALAVAKKCLDNILPECPSK